MGKNKQTEKKNTLHLNFTSDIKIKSKFIIVSNLKFKPIKLENITGEIFWILLGEEFFYLTLKAQSIKIKIDK
jgi:hypothetical protein